MGKEKESVTERYFDDVYNANEDPWNYEASGYEQEKYNASIKVLTKLFYKNVFEIGCSIGVLTEKLAIIAERLLAVDASEVPLIKARERLKYCHNVEIQKMMVPVNFGNGPYDLIVLSEVAYYLSVEDLNILSEKIIAHLSKKGQLLMVHWTPFVHDYPQTGDEVHEFFLQPDKGLKHLKHQRQNTYRIDLFEKS